MKRLLAAAFIVIGLCFPATAQYNSCEPGFCPGGIGVGFGPNGGNAVPSWVLSGASIDLDFANNQIFSCTFATCLSITRASNATDLLPSSTSGYAYNTFSSNALAISPTFGLLIFEARTNLLLNSTAPTTQTTGSLATGTYTLWVNGSGSAQMSLGTGVGCGAGTATNGVPVNFTISIAGTCIVTVIGSLNAFQLELGAFGTSFIVTAGATATRAADNISATGAFLALFTGSPPISIVAQTNQIASAGFGSTRILGNNGNGAMLFANSSTAIASYDGVTVLSATCGTGGPAGVVKSGASQQLGTGRTVVCNNGTVATDAAATTLNVGRVGSNGGAANFMNGILQRITGWNSRLSDPTLKAFTQ